MTAEFWQYDARLGRRWNVDPKPDISISPYTAFAGNPIYNSDPLGDTTVPGDWYRRVDGSNTTYKYAIGNDRKELDANSKVWWKIPEASRNRAVTFDGGFAPTNVQSSIDLHADGTFSVIKSDYREGSAHGSVKWTMQTPGGANVYVQGRDYLQSKAVGDGAFWAAAGALAGDKVLRVGGGLLTKFVAKSGGSTYAEGSFSVFNWNGYPAAGTKPIGPFRLLEGTEYSSARTLANKTNAALHKANPEMLKGMQIHEITSCKIWR